MTAVFMLAVLAINISSCKGKKSGTQANNKEDSLKQVIARGEYLANYVTPCMDCHSKRDFTKFAGPMVAGSEGMGGEMFDEKLAGIPGVVYAKNITPDNETGIGTWTDDEILRAMTHGISKNGDTLFPIMPYASFNHMAKEDLFAIIAYLRSLKPIKNKIPARQLMIPMSMAYPAPALQPSVDNNVRPPETEQVAYGGYLVNAAACAECHTPMEKGQPDFSRIFAGGFTFDAGIFKVTTANITPDSTGIGSWTEEMFLNKFKNNSSDEMLNRDPGKENTIMPWHMYAKMKESDLKAVYAYLRTVKPVNQKIEKYPK